MAAIPTTFSFLQLRSLSLQPIILNSKHPVFGNLREFHIEVVSFGCGNLKWCSGRTKQCFYVRAVGDSESSDDKRVGDGVEMGRRGAGSEETVTRLQGIITSLPPVLLRVKKNVDTNFAVGLFVAVVFLVLVIREIKGRRPRYNQHGSVADLVKRGQLRSDRRGISKPLKYDDPFNNPLVKVGKSNSTVEMCGKVYRLAPVTLTEDQQSSHQKRRSRAYQWKRPSVFLKEGDPIPPDVDPDTIRWIPVNHPFATTVSDIDEDMAQNNVYQKDGVPFRIRAEHEALQSKLETLQSEQKLNKIAIDPSNIRDFERPFKSSSKSREQLEQRPSTDHQGGLANTSKADSTTNSLKNNLTSEELQ